MSPREIKTHGNQKERGLNDLSALAERLGILYGIFSKMIIDITIEVPLNPQNIVVSMSMGAKKNR